MALGSLLDAGADLGEVLALLERLPLGGWALEVEPVLRGGIAATRAVVTVQDNVVVRTHAHIVGLVEEARLPDRVAAPGPGHLRRAGRRRGQAPPPAGRPGPLPRGRGTRHHRRRRGTAAALEVLGIDEVRASPVATGLGMVRAAHGMLPNPAPAVVALLEGSPHLGPERRRGADHPDRRGAARRPVARGTGRCRPMRVTGQGFGAGTRELDELPNCTQVVTGVQVGRLSGTRPASTRSARADADADADAGQPFARSRSTSMTPPASSWPMPWWCSSRPGPTTPG